MQKRHRIRSAGNGHQDGVSGCDHCIAGDRFVEAPI
jgi:hypothetical protein